MYLKVLQNSIPQGMGAIVQALALPTEPGRNSGKPIPGVNNPFEIRQTAWLLGRARTRRLYNANHLLPLYTYNPPRTSQLRYRYTVLRYNYTAGRLRGYDADTVAV